MEDKERRLYITEKINKFYEKMEAIMQNPNATTQEDGIKLLHEVNSILEEFEKLENPEGVEQFRIQFQLVKHRLQQAMFTSKPQEG